MNLQLTVCTTMLLSLMMASSITLANPEKRGRGAHLSRFINQFDTNNDNKITNEEFTTSIANRFNTMDADGNGSVSEDEFKLHAKSKHKKYRALHRAEMDNNKDGLISKQEFLDAKLKKAEKKFAKLDKDKDGQLSEQESTWKHKKFKKSKHYFPKIDTNNDGVISPEENKASAKNLFLRLDSNNDQVITQEEIQSMVQRHKNKD